MVLALVLPFFMHSSVQHVKNFSCSFNFSTFSHSDPLPKTNYHEFRIMHKVEKFASKNVILVLVATANTVEKIPFPVFNLLFQIQLKANTSKSNRWDISFSLFPKIAIMCWSLNHIPLSYILSTWFIMQSWVIMNTNLALPWWQPFLPLNPISV